jgi:hypothetical protein
VCVGRSRASAFVARYIHPRTSSYRIIHLHTLDSSPACIFHLHLVALVLVPTLHALYLSKTCILPCRSRTSRTGRLRARLATLFSDSKMQCEITTARHDNPENSVCTRSDSFLPSGCKRHFIPIQIARGRRVGKYELV